MSGLRLLMLHPGVAKISCDDCQRRSYDMETGLPQTFKSGPEGKETFYTIGHKAPCFDGWKCPKESPAKERDHLLSRKNDRVLSLYYRVRIVGIDGIGGVDPLLAENLAICDDAHNNFNRVERQVETTRLMSAIAKAGMRR